MPITTTVTIKNKVKEVMVLTGGLDVIIKSEKFPAKVENYARNTITKISLM